MLLHRDRLAARAVLAELILMLAPSGRGQWTESALAVTGSMLIDGNGGASVFSMVIVVRGKPTSAHRAEYAGACAQHARRIDSTGNIVPPGSGRRTFTCRR